MEEAKGVVKHILLAKFKDETPPEKIEELIKGYANLVNLIEPMKAFQWNDWPCTKFNSTMSYVTGERMLALRTRIKVSLVFESTFESSEGIAEYLPHPAHVEFSNRFLPSLEKVLVVDYRPTIVRC
ncbi:hypothetical protein DITRI_Ditri15bG0139400 [Diplodiscus trichospermus]